MNTNISRSLGPISPVDAERMYDLLMGLAEDMSKTRWTKGMPTKDWNLAQQDLARVRDSAEFAYKISHSSK